MRCLKCNRETDGNQVFCEECLAQMKQEPVKPGIPITLPKRPPSVPRTPPRPKIRPEEQIAHLEKKISRMGRWITALVMMVLILSSILIYTFFYSEHKFDIGQNYTPMTTLAPIEKK